VERGGFNTERTEIAESKKNPVQWRAISADLKEKSGRVAAALGRTSIYPEISVAHVIADVKTIRMYHLFV